MYSQGLIFDEYFGGYFKFVTVEVTLVACAGPFLYCDSYPLCIFQKHFKGASFVSPRNKKKKLLAGVLLTIKILFFYNNEIRYSVYVKETTTHLVSTNVIFVLFWLFCILCCVCLYSCLVFLPGLHSFDFRQNLDSLDYSLRSEFNTICYKMSDTFRNKTCPSIIVLNFYWRLNILNNEIGLTDYLYIYIFFLSVKTFDSEKC